MVESYVLVYDDEESILEVIQIILEDNGFKVKTSSHCEHIKEDIEKYNPPLILMDIWMKGINGHEITQELKSDEKTKYIPIILISALNETELIAKKVGADGFLKKPFEMDDLLKLVREKIVLQTLAQA
jgi:CheY-like chemotaxis protein